MIKSDQKKGFKPFSHPPMALLFLLLLFAATPSFGETRNVLPANAPTAENGEFSLQLESVRTLIDTDRQLDMQSALTLLLSQPSDQPRKRISFPSKAYWALAAVENNSQRQDWALSVPMPIMHKVEAWWVPDGAAPQSLAINQGRFFDSLTFLHSAELTLPANASGHLLLLMQADFTVAPNIYIETPETTHKQIRLHLVSLFVCLGAGGALVMYCFVLTIALRRWVYFVYCLFASSQLLLTSRISGLSQDWLAEDFQFILYAAATTTILAMSFTLLLLRDAHPPRWTIRTFIAILALNIICVMSWFTPWSMTAAIESLGVPWGYTPIILLSHAATLIIVLTCLRRSRAARLVFLGWVSLAAGYQIVQNMHLFTPIFDEIKVASLSLNYSVALEMLILALAMAVSVREARAREEQAVHAQHSAELVAKQRAEFVATVSHELSTPLHVVLGTIDQLDKTELPTEAKGAVTHLKYAGEALHSLTDNLLGYSASNNDTAQQHRDFSPARMVAAVSGLFDARAQSHGLNIAQRSPAEDLHVIGPAAALRRVIINLVSNAVKYTRNGEIKIASELVETADGLELQFEVADSGSGMDRETLAKLNQPGPSNRELEALYSSDPSSGLGLRITQVLIAEMGGKIHFSNRPRGGLSVRFAVPVVAANSPDSAVESATMELFAGMTVLVVDDLPSNLAITTGHLRQMGCKTLTADDAKGAREQLLSTASIDLLITDQRMEGGTGLELVAWLRQQPGPLKEIAAVIATAYIDETLQGNARALACGLISKPFDMQSLRETVNTQTQGNQTTNDPSTSDTRIKAFSEPLINLVQEVGIDSANIALELFQPQTEDDMAMLIASLEGEASNAESAEWRARAHRIASASGTLRVMAVRDLALAIEHIEIGEAEPKVVLLQQQLAAVYTAIEQVLAKVNQTPPKSQAPAIQGGSQTGEY